MAKPCTPHLIPQAAQLFEPKTANVRGRGVRPLVFLSGDSKGDTLFEKRVSPFICPFPHSAEISVSAPVQVYFLKLSFSVTDLLNTR